MTNDFKKALDAVNFAKQHGLSRLKVGTIEFEFSPIELSLQAVARTEALELTTANKEPLKAKSPSPSEAKDTTKTMLDSLAPTEADFEDESLLFLSSR